MTTAYDFSAKTLDGAEQPLSEFKGKTLLIVNVASKCGFTPQYKGLEELWRKYKDKGLVVLGFPCDQFGHQEPGDEAEIKNFCSLTYDVSFPMFAKVEVNGERRAPALQVSEEGEARLARHRRRSSGTSPSSWSTEAASVVKRYAPTDTPEKIEKDLSSVL